MTDLDEFLDRRRSTEAAAREKAKADAEAAKTAREAERTKAVGQAIRHREWTPPE